MVLFVPNIAPLCEGCRSRWAEVLCHRENSDIKLFLYGHHGERKGAELQTHKDQTVAGVMAKRTSGDKGLFSEATCPQEGHRWSGGWEGCGGASLARSCFYLVLQFSLVIWLGEVRVQRSKTTWISELFPGSPLWSPNNLPKKMLLRKEFSGFAASYLTLLCESSRQTEYKSVVWLSVTLACRSYLPTSIGACFWN